MLLILFIGKQPRIKRNCLPDPLHTLAARKKFSLTKRNPRGRGVEVIKEYEHHNCCFMDQHLIRRFFEKNCTPGEAEQVISFLSHHPHLIHHYLNSEEWDSTQPVQMDESFWDGAWEEIQAKKLRGKFALITKF